MATFRERLKDGMEIRNMTAAELCEKTGIGKSSISQYLSGRNEAKQDKLYLIAKALSVNEAWLMGYDVPMERVVKYSGELAESMAHIVKTPFAEDLLIEIDGLNDKSMDRLLEYVRMLKLMQEKEEH